MSFRKYVSVVVGILQGGLGVFAILFAYFFYYDIFGYKDILDISSDVVPVYLFLLFVFGLFSVISGGSLIYEWQENF